MFLSSLDIYEAWYYVWYAWLAAVLQRVASVAFGREIVAHSKATLKPRNPSVRIPGLANRWP